MTKNERGPVDLYPATAQLTVDGKVVTDYSELTERQYLWMFAQRPGMYVGRVTLQGVTGFLQGFHCAAERYGRPGLSGFREWLMSNYTVGENFAWTAQIQQIALPEWDFVTELTPAQESHTLAVLFDLLDRFLIERDSETATVRVSRASHSADH